MRDFITLLSLILITQAGAEHKMPGTARITYFGYENCILLENEFTRVVLTESAGRILEYSRRGPNAIYLDNSQEGITIQNGLTSLEPTGGRLDIGPEMTIPKHPRNLSRHQVRPLGMFWDVFF